MAKSKAELKGKLKMLPNWSEEVFRVTKVTKQKSKGLGNASFLYQIERTNGDPVRRLKTLVFNTNSGPGL